MDLGEILTPGRQALLILWEANVQTQNQKGEIKSINLDDKNIDQKIEQLKADIIGHFFEENIDEKALKKGAIIISETNKNYKYDKYLNQYISTQKKYGNTLITFFKFL